MMLFETGFQVSEDDFVAIVSDRREQQVPEGILDTELLEQLERLVREGILGGPHLV